MEGAEGRRAAAPTMLEGVEAPPTPTHCMCRARQGLAWAPLSRGRILGRQGL